MMQYKIYGALGSPYSLKVRAALRYKRLTHTWTGMTADDRARVMPRVKLPVIPVIHCPDDTWTNDSTPFLLSVEHEGRPLLPPTPTARFACLLLEDMADEWFMKTIFHYRWHYAEDATWCANWLMYDSLPNSGRTMVETVAETIRARQIARMALVGCTPLTAPRIEASWKRACNAMETLATGPARGLFGGALSLADFAFYGQLKVMSVDPTPMAWLRAEAPYLYRWLDHTDDAGGLSGEFADELSPPVIMLLAQCGDTYLPFLQANADALAAGAETFALDIEGGRYEQAAFKYQLKCLDVLRAAWAELPANERSELAERIGPGAKTLD
jgi:glutathione S-transferase